MPADDVILDFRQIAGYPSAGVQPNDALVLQRGGLGGPYYSATALELVGQALAQGGPMSVGVQAPADASGAQVFTRAVAGTFDGWHGWNAYSNGSEITRITSGPAALLLADPTTGWEFHWDNGPGGRFNYNAVLTITPDGYVGCQQALLDRNPLLPMEAATAQWVTETLNAAFAVTDMRYANCTVWSFNGRTGQVILGPNDILGAGGAPIASPHFMGGPTAPTPSAQSNDNSIATTQWVNSHIGQAAVQSFNGRSGAVVLITSDIASAGGLVNPNVALTGAPTATTPPVNDSSTRIATTAWVTNTITNIDLSNFAPLNSPAFSGLPTAPTAPPGAADGQIATTAFVQNAVTESTAGVASFNTRTGAVVLTLADVTAAGGAPIASPSFTGTPQGPTAALGTSNQQLATTAFVLAELAGGGTVTSFNTRTGAVTLTGADIASAGGALTVSPAFTGTPTSTTPPNADSSNRIATTAFVESAISSLGSLVSSFNGRAGAVTLIANDISGAGGAVLASPAFSGVPTAPTAAPGTNSAQIATTSFVNAAIAAGQGVSSFNGRTGAITLQATDITGAGGAPLLSPTFTGTPQAPTAAPGTNTTQLATTAFVAASLAAGAVTSFNTRTGSITLTLGDITGAGGAPNASPGLTGVPTAPTAAAATNTTQIATTAFVQQALNSIGAGVVSFNGRTGAVSLIANDISAAGGAVLASPAFTGTPTAPTAPSNTSTTQLATTAFVQSVTGAYLPLAGGTLTGTLNAIAANFTGVVKFPGVTAVPNAPNIDGPAGTIRSLNAMTSGVMRWHMQMANMVAETGSNVGSDFYIGRYSDAGALIDNPFYINRASGAVAIKGDTAGFNANAGMVGEVMTAVTPTPISFPNQQTQNIASITLTPGDWDIMGEMQFTASGNNIITAIQCAIGPTSGQIPALGINGSWTFLSFTVSALTVSVPVSTCRYVGNVSQNYYLMGFVNFASGAVTAMGKLWARRRR